MRFLAGVILVLFSTVVSAEYGSVTVDKYHYAYDGDTFYVDILAFPPLIGKDIPIRPRGFDTPEIRGKCEKEKFLAYEARDFIELLMAEGKEIRLVDIDRGNFFRLTADVLVDGESLAEIMISKGLAKSYDDPTRREWCD